MMPYEFCFATLKVVSIRMPYRLSACVLVLGFFAEPALTAPLSEDQLKQLVAVSREEQVEQWPELTPAQLRPLSAKAEAYAADYRRFHQAYGQTANVVFSDQSRKDVIRWDGLGDAATWTGFYLASLAFRYAVTEEKEVLIQINEGLSTYELLTRITGRSGYIARFAGEANDPHYKPYYSSYGGGPDAERAGLARWAFPANENDEEWVWLGHSSRDVYVGASFGLATVARLVADPNIQRRLKLLVHSILARLAEDGWELVAPDGKRAGTQFTPAMIAALLRLGATVYPDRYLEVYFEKARAFEKSPPPSLCLYCSYYPNNLHWTTYYVLASLESNADLRTHYIESLRQLWAQSRHHLNAYFAALYMSAGSELFDPIARATLQGCLGLFPVTPRWDDRVDFSNRKDLDVTVASNSTWAKYPLPVSERVPTDFLWQRSPCLLSGGTDAPLAFPGIDYLLPYWIGRHCGVIRKE